MSLRAKGKPSAPRARSAIRDPPRSRLSPHHHPAREPARDHERQRRRSREGSAPRDLRRRPRPVGAADEPESSLHGVRVDRFAGPRRILCDRDHEAGVEGAQPQARGQPLQVLPLRRRQARQGRPLRSPPRRGGPGSSAHPPTRDTPRSSSRGAPPLRAKALCAVPHPHPRGRSPWGTVTRAAVRRPGPLPDVSAERLTSCGRADRTTSRPTGDGGASAAASGTSSMTSRNTCRRNATVSLTRCNTGRRANGGASEEGSGKTLFRNWSSRGCCSKEDWRGLAGGFAGVILAFEHFSPILIGPFPGPRSHPCDRFHARGVPKRHTPPLPAYVKNLPLSRIGILRPPLVAHDHR